MLPHYSAAGPNGTVSYESHLHNIIIPNAIFLCPHPPSTMRGNMKKYTFKDVCLFFLASIVKCISVTERSSGGIYVHTHEAGV